MKRREFINGGLAALGIGALPWKAWAVMAKRRQKDAAEPWMKDVAPESFTGAPCAFRFAHGRGFVVY